MSATNITQRLVRCILLQKGRRQFAYYHAGRHRVSGRDTRQNGSIGDSKTVHAVHLEVAIDDRHGVSAHFRGTGLMPESAEAVATEALQFRHVAIAGCYLVSGKWP